MSNINYVSINENFPVAGEDNDTQVFRDNFDTIKTSLRIAKEELEIFQDSDVGAALKGQDNDFNNKIISRALFQETANRKLQGGLIGTDTTQLNIDFQEGNYQIFKIVGASPGPRVLPISFDNFPQNSNPLQPLAVGKVILELTSDGANVSLNVISTNGTTIRTNGFPGGQSYSNILLSSANAPVFLEVWRHNQDNIFIKYVGQFN